MKTNYILVLLILLAFFVISFLTNILGALNPSVSLSYNLSETMAGFLPFSFFIAYGVMSIPAGFMIEKYGEKRMMLIGFALALFASVFFACIPSFNVFLFSLFTIGTGMAILQVVINPLLRESGGKENYAFTSVMGQLIFGVASFVSPLVYSWLVTSIGNAENTSLIINLLSGVTSKGMSWTSIYWIFAFLSLILIVLVFLIKFPNVSLEDDEKVGTKESYLLLFKNRTVQLFFFGLFAYVGVEQGISYWMSKFLQTYHGFDYETTGASAVANFWGLMTIGGVVGLILLKFIDSKLVLKIFTSLAILSLSFALFGSAEESLYGFQYCGFLLSVMYPIIFSLGLNSIDKLHGAFAGILVSGIMGGAVIQLLIGFISDFTSLKVGMLLNFVLLLYIFYIGFSAKPLINNKTINLKDKFK
ncbi:MFS transporter [Mariniflexile jejuense]|uniref:MFS transporter n=1 Tax=Mariniflexile jejuense TaxID=1173582 RepID=A0ABW3JNT0_9FLAO